MRTAVVMFTLLTTSCAALAFPPPTGLGRRLVLSSALALAAPTVNSTDDPLSTWTGFVPPPIEREITYQELIYMLDAHEIASLQPAVQHDYVVATTDRGHRLSCRLSDAQLPRLALDSIRDDYAVQILPRDQSKDTVRSIAQFWLAVWLGRKLVVDTL